MPSGDDLWSLCRLNGWEPISAIWIGLERSPGGGRRRTVSRAELDALIAEAVELDMIILSDDRDMIKRKPPS